MKLYLDEVYSNELRSHREYDNIFTYAENKIKLSTVSRTETSRINNGYIEILCESDMSGKTSEDVYATFEYGGNSYVMHKQKIHKKLSRFYYLFDSDFDAANIDVIVAYK